MKPKSEVVDRVRALLQAEFDTRCQLASQRLPHMCANNYRHTLDFRKKVEDQKNEIYNRITKGPKLPVIQTIGLCMLGADNPQEWLSTICEDPIDAQRCPDFTATLDKSEIWNRLQEQVNDTKWLQEHMPEVAVLLWVLETPVAMPWWSKVWCWFSPRIQREPQLPPLDLNSLLPPS